MSEADWIRYLATLPPDLATMCRNIVERCTTVIAGEQLRHLEREDTEQAARIAGDQALRNAANSDHMLIQDQKERIEALEEDGAASHTG